MHLSRFDGELKAAAEAKGDLDAVFAALGVTRPSVVDRQDAMACFLSGEEGWRAARDRLQGAFAPPSQTGTGLTSGKDK